MASIHREIRIAATPDTAWSALRDVGALHTRLVPGFVVDTKLEGDGVTKRHQHLAKTLTRTCRWWRVPLEPVTKR